MGLIQEFNRRQAILGGLCIAGGVLILVIMWMVIDGIVGAISIFTDSGGGRPMQGVSPPRQTPHSPVPAVLVITSVWAVGAWHWWSRGYRYRVFPDRLFVAGLRREQGEDIGPFAVGDDEEPVTGFRDLLAQILLGGPRLICTGAARIQSRLPNYPDLEQRMQTLLERLRAQAKWQPALAYADQAEEMGALLRLGLAEFSFSKMLVKAVSDKPAPPPPDEEETEKGAEPQLPAAVVQAPSSPIPSLTVSQQPIKPIAKMAAPTMPPPKAPPATAVDKKPEPDGGTPV